MTHISIYINRQVTMGSCAVKSSNVVIEQPPESDVNQIFRIMVNGQYEEVKCPICCKPVGLEDPEIHLVMCLTRPKLDYNEDKVAKFKGTECVICLEEFEEDDIIARLPCLCIYHKICLEAWFKVNRSCPQHPG